MRAKIFSGLAVAYVLAIVAFSLVPADLLGDVYSAAGVLDDTILHVAGFLVLGFLFCRAFRAFRSRHAYLYSAAAGLLVGLMIELAQMLLDYRHSQSMDLFLHAAGVCGYCLAEGVIMYLRDYYSEEALV
jgi:glycopeptide antibiotics resistance protein